MDWNIFCSACGVVIALATIIITCFRSLSSDIRQIDQRLSRMEGAFEERGKWESRRKEG